MVTEHEEYPMNVVLLGATGFVGSALLKEALDRGHVVTAIVRHLEKLEKREGLTAKAGVRCHVVSIHRRPCGHPNMPVQNGWPVGQFQRNANFITDAKATTYLFLPAAVNRRVVVAPVRSEIQKRNPPSGGADPSGGTLSGALEVAVLPVWLVSFFRCTWWPLSPFSADFLSGWSSNSFESFRSSPARSLADCPINIFVLASLNPSRRANSQILASCSPLSLCPMAGSTDSSAATLPFG